MKTWIAPIVLLPALSFWAVAADAADQGKAIYDRACIGCHGPDGKGAVHGVPDLAMALSQSDEVLMQRILDGYQTPGAPLAMPPKGGDPSLTKQDLAAVLAYLHKAFGR